MTRDVVARLLDQAARHPHQAAVVEGEACLTYGQLAARARGLAAALSRFGPHPKVAILLPQGGEAYAAMFGTLLAGGYYLPCNTESVPAKLAAIMAQFKPDVVIGGDGMEGLGLPVIRDWASQEEAVSPRPPHDLAYVIFTSGSTGIPKGVMIPRSGLNAYTAWALDAMTPGPGDRWSQHPNIGFDLSVLDVYGALCSGAALYPLQSRLDRMLPGRFIARHGLTIWNSVPSVVDMMAKAGDLTPERMASVRLFTFCGEPLYAAQVAGLLAANPQAVVHNTYGPTEATVSCTLVAMTVGDYRRACDDTVALGDAIPGMRLHLVECDQGRELAISGPQLARGYWGDEARSHTAFRPLALADGEVLAYFTGDLVREKDGQLYFERRRDTQVKIRGYRLELDEINAVLRGLGMAEAATILADGKLHSFVVAPGGLDEAALRLALEKRLEPHAVPSYIHALAQLPRNANDKTDLATLTTLAGKAQI